MTQVLSERDNFFRAMTEAVERARTDEQVCNVMLVIIKQRENTETGKIEISRSLRHNYEDGGQLVEDLLGVTRNVLTEGLSNAPEGEF